MPSQKTWYDRIMESLDSVGSFEAELMPGLRSEVRGVETEDLDSVYRILAVHWRKMQPGSGYDSKTCLHGLIAEVRDNVFRREQDGSQAAMGPGWLYVPMDGRLVYGVKKVGGKWFVTDDSGKLLRESGSLEDALYMQKSMTKRYVTRRDETMGGVV